jgi:chorismate dehydratase
LHANLLQLSKKIRVGAVSYLNTKPLLYGLQHHAVYESIELMEDYPANLARALQENAIDIGLVPVAVIPGLAAPYIISDFCIGATGPVASVCIFSQVPMESIQSLYLDYQSKTSVNLARILLKNYWKQDVLLLEAPSNFMDLIDGTTAAVIIGDRALEKYNSYAYRYDLAEAWINYTDKPFVFATWVSNKPLDDVFITNFNEANALGIENIDTVVEQLSHNDNSYNLHTYFTKNISYTLDAAKKEGMAQFLSLL